jgi:putative solute:sodium symporter small subunit
MGRPELVDNRLKDFWKYVRNLTIALLVVWSVFAVFIHLLALSEAWRNIRVLGYPAHWLFGTQISIVAYIVIIFTYAYLVSKKEEEVV